ncbi:MAG TPA: dihydrodipicolinate synthase family protein, partial [Gammaproteobacteria bacterium]|nr:dihydrodipicolinate synthase family protein [Gammaproteobacteria bacterium]
MIYPPIRGVLVPLLTPFNDDMTVATDLYVAHAWRLLDQGCAGLVPFGTTGEALSVGIDERIAAVQALVDAGIDPALMIPGTGLSNVTDTARLSRACLDMGCSGVMTLPPFYYKGVGEEGLYRHFVQVIEAIGDGARIFLYHIPPIAIVGIPVTLAARLHAEFPGQVVGIKDSSGDWDNTRALLGIDGLIVYPGSELPLVEALELGAPGCISATANLNGAAIANLITAYFDGDTDRVHDLQQGVRQFRLRLQDSAPIPAQKRLLALATGDARWANVRPPFLAMPEADGRDLLDTLRREFGFEV